MRNTITKDCLKYLKSKATVKDITIYSFEDIQYASIKQS